MAQMFLLDLSVLLVAVVVFSARPVLTSRVAVRGPAVIGEDNEIYQFTSIGRNKQDLKYKGEATRRCCRFRL